MKILILGHGDHGKDKAAEMLRDMFGLKFRSSSVFIMERAVYPVLKKKYGYDTPFECYADRHNHRQEWYELIAKYNTPDPTRLTRELLREYDIYVGLRHRHEYLYTKKFYDLVLWIDASERKPLESSSSFTINFDATSMTRIDNNGSLDEMADQLRQLPIPEQELTVNE